MIRPNDRFPLARGHLSTAPCRPMVAVIQRAPLFEYPPLPRRELQFYILVVIATIIYGYYSVFKLSWNYKFHIGDPVIVNRLPVIGERFKDISNWEWFRWAPYQLSVIPHMLIHSILFNVSSKFLHDQYVAYFTIFYSLIGTSIVFSPRLVLISLGQGTVIFLVRHFVRRTSAVWVSALPILYISMHRSALLHIDPFLVIVFVAYSLLSYISFNIEILAGECRPEDNTVFKQYIRMLFYTLYPPYMVSLIVLYPEFEKQMRERNQNPRNWRYLTTFVLRIAFWWLCVETILHFFYFEAILNNSKVAETLPKDTLVAIGMLMGNFFHMKYVVIFGVPSIFALIDGMRPPPPPICFARVMLYSKIWRNFDRGLYAFFKKYIFVPICAPTFSITRKLFGLLISYAFVLLWHGVIHSNVIWILLNITELFVEYGSKSLYSLKFVRTWRETHITDVTFRRILGWSHILPFALGLYSNFYFLGGSRIGYLFVRRIFEEETLTLRWPTWLLFALGYCYSNVCMEMDRWFADKQKLKAA
ncbi:hypothetical protein AB6A40_004725 [Gnathostoma spinigerum]|uniref:Protein-cysteine N-palmitoyltransferase Rasp n=1 Tax=Gnathostoma spinigerum TaxID=75299 RepID=A0ABD6EFM8_9BILA